MDRTLPGRYYFVGRNNRECSELVEAGAQSCMLGRISLGTLPYRAHSFRLAFAGYYTRYWGEPPREVPLPDAITIQGIAIGHGPTADPAAARWIAGTFDGRSAVVVGGDSGSSGALSDDVIAEDEAVPAGHHLWAVLAARVRPGGSWPRLKLYTAHPEEGLAFSTQSLAGRLLDASHLELEPGTAVPCLAPTFVVARGSDGEAVVLTYGDSIAWGQYDSAFDARMRGAIGFVPRGLAAAGVSGHSIAVPSAMGSHWVQNGRAGNVSAKLDLIGRVPNRPFTHLLCQIGTNDCGNWPEPHAFIAGQRDTLARLRAEFPGAPLYQTTLLPRGRSDDGCTSLEGQHPDDYTGANGGNLAHFNAALRDGALGDLVDGCVDVARAVEASGDPRRFALCPERMTLVADCAAGACELSVAEPVDPGDCYVLGGAASVVRKIGTDGAAYRVAIGNPTPRAFPAGTLFAATLADDYLHPTRQGHRRIAPVIEAWARSLTRDDALRR